VTHLDATLMIGPDAAGKAEAHVHDAGYRDDLIIAAVRVAGLTIQSNHETGPGDLAAFFDALAVKVREAHAVFVAQPDVDREGDQP
jgi:hypothetical protein